MARLFFLGIAGVFFVFFKTDAEASSSRHYHCDLEVGGVVTSFVDPGNESGTIVGDYEVFLHLCGPATLKRISTDTRVSAYDLTHTPEQIFLQLSSPDEDAFVSCYRSDQ